MKQSKTSTKARSRRRAGSWSPVAGKQDLPDPSKPVPQVPQEPSSASREQVREVAPPVTAARESKRPMERSKQRRSRRS
jgi:hypothetical protein